MSLNYLRRSKGPVLKQCHDNGVYRPLRKFLDFDMLDVGKKFLVLVDPMVNAQEPPPNINLLTPFLRHCFRPGLFY